jgi:hypothetical protein
MLDILAATLIHRSRAPEWLTTGVAPRPAMIVWQAVGTVRQQASLPTVTRSAALRGYLVGALWKTSRDPWSPARGFK